MLAWITCGILGVIVLWLLFLLAEWRHFCYENRHDRVKSSWLVFEKDGLVRYGSHYERRWLRPPKHIQSRVIEKPKSSDGESIN